MRRIHIKKFRDRVPGWNFASYDDSVLGTDCLYKTRPANNGAVVCPGEITQIFIDRLYSDGTCYITVGDGWALNLLTDKIDICDIDDIAEKLFNTQL